MENASKALLIAGAILIVILLIGVGMMVFNGAKENVDSSLDTVSAQQVQVFNSQFAAYEGDQKGSNVRALNQAIQASNAKSDVKVSLEVKDSTGATINVSKVKSTGTYNVAFSYGNGTEAGYIKTITATEQ